MGLRRKPVAQQVQVRAGHKPFIAPTKGWYTATNLAAAPDGAAQVLSNFYPTTTGIKMRSGSRKHATLSDAGEPTESAMSYIGGVTRKMFAASDGNVFETTTVADADTEPATPEVVGQTSNYYSAVNYSNVGGYWMLAANGTDPMLLYDGSYFYPLGSTAIYGLDYDAETAPFTLGETVTGGTSGATGVIVRVIDEGTTGRLHINSLSGNFQDNETITDGAGGSATANGTEGTALIPALTGVNTSSISHVNVYRNRAWLVEGGTMNAHYLATDAVTGATAGVVSLSGVFKHGGSLLFTATWSLDSGNGLDDKIVFVSTEGEVAVWQGDPTDTAWSIVGRYDASPPMGKNAFLTVGGDLLILTKIGLVPLTAIIQKDPAALALAAVSRNIQPDWEREARERGSLPWEIVKWTSRNIAYITCPVTADVTITPPIAFAVNLETGAWSKIEGWNMRCVVLHNEQVYFGTNAGTFMQADIGGTDDGELIYYTYVGHHDHLGAVGSFKTVMQARAVFRTKTEFTPQIGVTTNYDIMLPAYPNAATVTASAGEWDVGLWDVAKWDTGLSFYTVQTRWVSIGVSGFTHAPILQIVSGSTAAPSAELIVFDTTYETGDLVV